MGEPGGRRFGIWGIKRQEVEILVLALHFWTRMRVGRGKRRKGKKRGRPKWENWTKKGKNDGEIKKEWESFRPRDLLSVAMRGYNFLVVFVRLGKYVQCIFTPFV